MAQEGQYHCHKWLWGSQPQHLPAWEKPCHNHSYLRWCSLLLPGHILLLPAVLPNKKVSAQVQHVIARLCIAASSLQGQDLSILLSFHSTRADLGECTMLSASQTLSTEHRHFPESMRGSGIFLLTHCSRSMEQNVKTGINVRLTWSLSVLGWASSAEQGSADVRKQNALLCARFASSRDHKAPSISWDIRDLRVWPSMCAGLSTRHFGAAASKSQPGWKMKEAAQVLWSKEKGVQIWVSAIKRLFIMCLSEWCCFVLGKNKTGTCW